MNWTINNKTPEELGVTVASWSEESLLASELILEVVAEDYAADPPAELAFNTPVSVKLNGQQLYKGKVRIMPRMASGASEGMSYTILDAFDELDRVVYHEERNYATNVAYTDDFAVVTTQPYKVGAVLFEDDEPLGDRIKEVLEYAIGVGVDLQVGTIYSGIDWFRAEYKDQTCGEIIRDIMRLMPECIFWIDNKTNPPTANMKLRSAMPSLSFDISGGDVMLNHDIVELESERVRGVVIKYEIPVSVDGKNYTFLIVDSAGATEGVDVVVETVAIQAASFESEYARVVCRDIPQDEADHEDQIEWWISQTPELASIADEVGMQELVDLLKIAQTDDEANAVKKHTVKIIDDGIERPDPVNPNVSPLQVPPVEQTLEAEDYPRQIIEGNLPEWAGKRFRTVRATATIGVKTSELDNVENAGLKARLEEIFNLPKSYDSNDYMTANFTGEVMGTNAVTKNYKRLMSFDLNEPIPEGLAQQLYSQFNQRRFNGSVTLKGEEIDTATTLGKGINFTGGQSAWTNMNEAIQSVNYDVASGETNVTFGVPELLGANDLIERLRAARKNGYSHNFQSDKEVKEGVGGVAATPMSKFNRVGGGGGAAEECVLGDLLSDSENEGKFKIRPGYVYGGGTNIFIEKDNITPAIGDHLYIEVSWTAEEEDGVLLTGGSMTAAEIKQGGSVPDDDDFTPTALTGKHYKALGTWVDNDGNPKWQKDGCGSYYVQMCSNGKTGSF